MVSRPPLHGLYLIVGSGLPADHAEQWLLPGVAWVQYRNKRADRTTQCREAAALSALCRARGVGFIVNDDADLAGEIGADGVHLGRNDATTTQARNTLGIEAVIGVSCYDSPQRALEAQRDSADYVAFGALFASHTKPEATRISPRDLTRYKQKLTLPVCAIGGINRANLDQALATGADLIAVNTDVAAAPDPADAVGQYLARIT